MQHYTLVAYDNKIDLEKDVQQKLDYGWQCVGGCHVTYAAEDRWYFAQAMACPNDMGADTYNNPEIEALWLTPAERASLRSAVLFANLHGWETVSAADRLLRRLMEDAG